MQQCIGENLGGRGIAQLALAVTLIELILSKVPKLSFKIRAVSVREKFPPNSPVLAVNFSLSQEQQAFLIPILDNFPGD